MADFAHAVEFSDADVLGLLDACRLWVRPCADCGGWLISDGRNILHASSLRMGVVEMWHRSLGMMPIGGRC